MDEVEIRSLIRQPIDSAAWTGRPGQRCGKWAASAFCRRRPRFTFHAILAYRSPYIVEGAMAPAVELQLGWEIWLDRYRSFLRVGYRYFWLYHGSTMEQLVETGRA